jgi:hypothetical protein
MKKCPTCEKTFDDNLKFCQTDGTLLVEGAEEKPEDPYKTTVANVSDLPIPAFDPLKTMVAGPPPADEPKTEVKEDVEEEIDMMKTLVSSEVPKFDPVLKPVIKEEPKMNAPSKPAESLPTESDNLEGLSKAIPNPPKFNEPNLNPPSFGQIPPQSMPPKYEPPTPIQTPSEPIQQKPLDSKPFEMSQPHKNKPNDFSGDSPYGDTKNVPIPSPFDLSMPPGYQIPSAPMPPYKEAEVEEIKAEALNTPFAEEVQQGNQQIEAQGWNPPPSPNADWQNQQIGQNTPFQPPPAGVGGQNKTMAFVALGLGIVGLLGLIPALIIPLCGAPSMLLGIGAIVTGFLARSRAKAQPEQYGGAGLGIGGLVLGVLCLIAPIAIFIFYFVLSVGLSTLSR